MSIGSYAIETHGITRSFDSRKGFLFREVTHTEALRGIDLTVDHGAIFGLLGPNGAGKTTFTKILATLLLPTSGHALVLGHDVVRETGWLRRASGSCSEGNGGSTIGSTAGRTSGSLRTCTGYLWPSGSGGSKRFSRAWT